MGIALRPAADGVPDRRLPALHAALEAQPLRNAPRRVEQPGPDPRAAAARPGRRPAASSTSRTSTRASTARTRCTSTASHYKPSSDGAYLPGLLRPRRRRQARPDVDLPADARATTPPASGPTTTTRRRWTSRSPAACTGCSRSSAATSAPPDREFVVVFAPMGEFQTIDGRAFVGNTPVFTLQGRRARAVGRDGDGLRAPHLPRPRPPLGDADGAPRDTQTVGPAESFKIRWREEDPGTWLYHCHVETAHDGRDDRDLPGAADEARRRSAGARSLLARAPAARPRRACRHDHGGARRAGRRLDRLRRLRAARTSTSWRATRSRWTNDSVRARTPSPPTTAASTRAAVRRRRRSRTASTAPGAVAYYCRCTPSCAARSTSTDVLLDAPAEPRRAGPAVRAARAARRCRAGTPVAIEADDGSGLRARSAATTVRRTTARSARPSRRATTTRTARGGRRRGEPAGAAAGARPHGHGARDARPARRSCACR